MNPGDDFHKVGRTLNEQVGLSEYRIDAGFVFGYALLYAGLLFFGWDPRYVFLGIALETVLMNVGLIIRAFMTARKSPSAILIASLLCLPPLAVSLGIAAMPAYRIVTDRDFDASTIGWLFFAGFFLSSLYSEWQRFQRVTLPQARFTIYFDKKYVFADGKPVFVGASHVLSSVIGSWLNTGIFLFCWFIASGVGAFDGGEGNLLHYSLAAAVTLVTLCLIKQLATIGILRMIFRKQSNQEELWLKTYSQAGEIVLRSELPR